MNIHRLTSFKFCRIDSQRIFSFPGHFLLQNIIIRVNRMYLLYTVKMMSCLKLIAWVALGFYFHIMALRKIRSALDLETANTVACSIVASRIDYCNSLFYGMTVQNLSKLQRSENCCTHSFRKSTLRSYFACSQGVTLASCAWTSGFQIGCMTFKALMDKQPTYLADVVHTYVPSRNLRSSTRNLLDVPFVQTRTATRAFSVAAPTILE